MPYSLTHCPKKNPKKRLAHSHSLVLQGVWTHWIDYVEPFNFSWNNIIYNIHPKLLSFMLNSMINSVATPDMLRLWNLHHDASCFLCSKSPCTLHHILVHCQPALDGKRYNWRHDSVLYTLEPVLSLFIQQHNHSHKPSTHSHTATHFQRSGDTTTRKKRTGRPSVLHDATDWKLLIDYDHAPIVFPPQILPTDTRPDIIIWSVATQRIIMFALTCGAE